MLVLKITNPPVVVVLKAPVEVPTTKLLRMAILPVVVAPPVIVSPPACRPLPIVDEAFTIMPIVEVGARYAVAPVPLISHVLPKLAPPPPVPQATPVLEMVPSTAKVAHPAVPPALDTVSLEVEAIFAMVRLPLKVEVERAPVVEVPTIMRSKYEVEEAAKEAGVPVSAMRVLVALVVCPKTEVWVNGSFALAAKMAKSAASKHPLVAASAFAQLIVTGFTPPNTEALELVILRPPIAESVEVDTP